MEYSVEFGDLNLNMNWRDYQLKMVAQIEFIFYFGLLDGFWWLHLITKYSMNWWYDYNLNWQDILLSFGDLHLNMNQRDYLLKMVIQIEFKIYFGLFDGFWWLHPNTKYNMNWRDGYNMNWRNTLLSLVILIWILLTRLSIRNDDPNWIWIGIQIVVWLLMTACKHQI